MKNKINYVCISFFAHLQFLHNAVVQVHVIVTKFMSISKSSLFCHSGKKSIIFPFPTPMFWLRLIQPACIDARCTCLYNPFLMVVEDGGPYLEEQETFRDVVHFMIYYFSFFLENTHP